MFSITSFYVFSKLSPERQNYFLEYFNFLEDQENWLGLIIMGAEGLNATIANISQEIVDRFKKKISAEFPEQEILFKDSVVEQQPFKRFKVYTRDEIVTLGHPELVPHGKCRHLSPEEWQAVLESSEDYVLLDTRNTYETEIGVFKGAIDPKIQIFGEFSDKIKELNLPKDKKILMYCTGGIRCEKAILAMEQAGYENVYQLEGGILAYLEKFPNKNFTGECFVFDQRVAVDQELKASAQYKLCPHCGNAANMPISCSNCEVSAVVCSSCLDLNKPTCSKNCQHHYLKLNKSAKSSQHNSPHLHEA